MNFNDNKPENMLYGFLYCCSNEATPGLLKIDLSFKTPDLILSDANNSNNWSPPFPYKMEIAKQVFKPEQKLAALHTILDTYSIRINPDYNFFKLSICKAKAFFDLIDGEAWEDDNGNYHDIYAIVDINDNKLNDNKINDNKINDNKINDNPPIYVVDDINNNINEVGCRDMKKCFVDGQCIRHIIYGIIWIGIYDYISNSIILDNIKPKQTFMSLSAFAMAHHKIEGSRRKTANGWRECEVEVNGKWVSTSNLKPLIL